MTDKQYFEATPIINKLQIIKSILLPENITDVDGKRNDGSGIIDETYDALNVKIKSAFSLIGKQDSYNQYFIILDDLRLNAEESTKVIKIINEVLSDRKKVLLVQLNSL